MNASPAVSPTVRKPWLRMMSARLPVHVLRQPFAFLERQRQAFPVVVADLAVEHRRVLHEVFEAVRRAP